MRPLRGAPLTGPTGLSLLVGNTVFDLDAGTSHPVTGLPDLAGTIRAQQVGATAVISFDCPDCGPNSRLYAVSGGSAGALPLGSGNWAAPGHGGVWVKVYRTASRCTLAEIDLTGRTVREARGIDCAGTPRAETELGLLARIQDGAGFEDVILAPGTLHRQLRADRIHAVVGSRVLSGDAGGFMLTDHETGRAESIALPTSVGFPSDGLVSPDQRFVAIAFEHPAWPGPRQRMDLWLLDLDTAQWTRLPAMPLPVALKATDMTWAPDGRLVAVGAFEQVGRAVVTWRPGDAQLRFRPVDLPSAETFGVVRSG
ncbi:MAG: hypothetical protein L0Y54_21990 [Sporichthyaceae bacterium]|nr:hypothetical protein [Sporichthyaceae bacterium]